MLTLKQKLKKLLQLVYAVVLTGSQWAYYEVEKSTDYLVY